MYAAFALTEHGLLSDHQVDLSKATLFDAHTQTRCMLESWHIQHQQAPLNSDRGTLPGLYAALMDFFSTLCLSRRFLHFLYSYTSRDHIIVWLTYCIYTFVPVSVNHSLMKAAIGCWNVRTSKSKRHCMCCAVWHKTNSWCISNHKARPSNMVDGS